jgi:hypothetical protein
MRWFWIEGRWLSAEDDVKDAVRAASFALRLLRPTHERLSRRRDRHARKRAQQLTQHHSGLGQHAAAGPNEAGRSD